MHINVCAMHVDGRIHVCVYYTIVALSASILQNCLVWDIVGISCYFSFQEIWLFDVSLLIFKTFHI